MLIERKLQPVDCFLSIFLLASLRPFFLSYMCLCRKRFKFSRQCAVDSSISALRYVWPSFLLYFLSQSRYHLSPFYIPFVSKSCFCLLFFHLMIRFLPLKIISWNTCDKIHTISVKNVFMLSSCGKNCLRRICNISIRDFWYAIHLWIMNHLIFR